MRWATAPSSFLFYCTRSASLRFRTGCPPDVQCYLPTEGCDKTPESKTTAICQPVIIIYFFYFHYSPPYVTVFSVWIAHCLFLLISFITIFNFNDLQLLRIFFRAKLHFSSVRRKTTRTYPLFWEIQRCRIFCPQQQEVWRMPRFTF